MVEIIGDMDWKSCLEFNCRCQESYDVLLAMDSFNYLCCLLGASPNPIYRRSSSATEPSCLLGASPNPIYRRSSSATEPRQVTVEDCQTVTRGFGMEGEGSANLVDVLKDEGRNEIPIFKNATSCLVKSHPETLLEVRDQGKTDACVPFVVTASMYGEEIHRTGRSVEASPQEIHDFIFFHKRPPITQGVPPQGPFKVPARGFRYSFKSIFSYVIHRGVSPASFYKWVNGRSRFKRCSGIPWDGRVTNRQGLLISREKKIFIERYTPVIPNAKFDSMALRGTEEYEQLNAALDRQPLTGCIDATARFCDMKGDEIYKAIPGELILGPHAITLVGYGREGEDDYFICQNSWGIGWAKLGYGRILRKDVTRIYVPVNTHIPNKRKKTSVSLGEGDGSHDMGSSLKKQKK